MKAPPSLSPEEVGRRSILLGWLLTLAGVGGYVLMMSRAGESSDLLDAIADQGALGWTSLLLILTGVLVWAFGNIAVLQHHATAGDEDE